MRAALLPHILEGVPASVSMVPIYDLRFAICALLILDVFHKSYSNTAFFGQFSDFSQFEFPVTSCGNHVALLQ